MAGIMTPKEFADTLPCFECGDGRGWTVEPHPYSGEPMQVQCRWCHDFRDELVKQLEPLVNDYANQIADAAYEAGQRGEVRPTFSSTT